MSIVYGFHIVEAHAVFNGHDINLTNQKFLLALMSDRLFSYFPIAHYYLLEREYLVQFFILNISSFGKRW